MSNVLDEHSKNLGKIVANLQSLEFSLRVFLLEADGTRSNVDYSRLNVGDQIAEDAFTNWDQLSDLIRKYNERVMSIDSSMCIDHSIVEIRHALAHGRVSAYSPEEPMHLLKFSEPKNKHVEVTYNAEMNATWFGEQIKRVLDAIIKVVDACKKLGMATFNHS